MSRSEKSITVTYFPSSRGYVIQFGTKGVFVSSFDSVIAYMKEQFGVDYKTEVRP